MTDFDKTKREPLLQEERYHDSVAFKEEDLADPKVDAMLADPNHDRGHQKGLSWDRAYTSLELLIQRYSGGDSLDDLRPYAERAFAQFQRHYQTFPEPERRLKLWEPDAYQYVLWLLALAVLFNLPEGVRDVARWISTEPDDGQDVLVRRLFARLGMPDWPGDTLIHERPYAHLLRTLDADADARPQAMTGYLKQWYRGMRDCYWYDRHKRRAGFFGYWAFEAGMVTLLWDIDDSSYRNLPYYPKDLVDDARARHVADAYATGHMRDPSPGLRARSGQPCPWPGTWECEDLPVGKQTVAHGVPMPFIDGRAVTWLLVRPL